MRVLLWNRPDAEQAPGGDTVQWRHTGQALQGLGLDVTWSLAPAAALDLDGFDLVHVFNLQSEASAWPVAERALAAGLPLALSTIWWDLSEGRYQRRLRRKASFRLREALWGRARSLARFRAWDRSRPRGRARDEAALRLLQAAGVLLPNSRLEVTALEDFFGLALAGKSAVIPNAITPPPGSLRGGARDGEERERRGIVCAGRVGPIKNQLALIEAARGLGPLWIVGPAEEGDYLRECRRAAAAHGACELLPARPQAELWPLYRRARVHALVSYRETPGLVSLEAAACGCGVVSTDRGSAREYFADEARFCDPTDRASIRSALEQALGAPQVVSPERLARFTWERAAAATLEAYRWLLGAGGHLATAL